MLDLGKMLPSKMNPGISHKIGKTTSKPTKTSINLKVPSELKALRVNPHILNIARQRSAPGSKSVFWKAGRLENHDFNHLG